MKMNEGEAQQVKKNRIWRSFVEKRKGVGPIEC